MSLIKNLCLLQGDYLRTDHVDVKMSHFRKCHAGSLMHVTPDVKYLGLLFSWMKTFNFLQTLVYYPIRPRAVRTQL